MSRAVRARPATPTAIAPFGRMITSSPSGPPGRSGNGWECWYPVDTLECGWPLGLGIVHTRHRAIIVDAMERHTHTFELLYPHDHDLIQPLAPPADLDDPEARPDADHVMAFRIPVGSALLMHPGTWHSPAFPVSRDCTYSFACMDPPFHYVPEWIPFSGDLRVTVHNEPSPDDSTVGK